MNTALDLGIIDFSTGVFPTKGDTEQLLCTWKNNALFVCLWPQSLYQWNRCAPCIPTSPALTSQVNEDAACHLSSI